MGETFSWRRSVDAQGVFLADRLVPAAEQEAGIIDVVVEVVVGEEDVVDLSREETDLDEFVCCGGPAVEHEFFAFDVEDECRSEAGGCWVRSACSEDVDFGVGFGAHRAVRVRVSSVLRRRGLYRCRPRGCRRCLFRGGRVWRC